MKKLYYPLAAFIIISLNMCAQSFNVSISGGYALPLAPQLRYSNYTAVSNPNVQGSSSVIQGTVFPVSYGSGGNVALSGDWYSKVNIGFGLKLNAFFSAPVIYYSSIQGGRYTSYYDNTDKAYSYQAIPHVNFKLDFQKVSPYVEMGMVIGITNIKNNYTAIDNAGNADAGSQNFYGGVLLGFYSSLGISVKLTKLIRFTAAFNCSVASYSPASYKILSFTSNGVNQIANIQTQGSFVKQYYKTPGGTNEPKFSEPFSGIGLNMGLCLTLPKKTEQRKREQKNAEIHPF